MTDLGAQSCLWSLDEFCAAGFPKEHVLDVQMNLIAANISPTLLPRIQVHALIYETAYFCNWLGGFVFTCMHLHPHNLVHAPIYEARIGQTISKR